MAGRNRAIRMRQFEHECRSRLGHHHAGRAPLKSASVTFQPKDGGRPSFGVTNGQGRYVLEYSLKELGAKVGACTVKITTESRGDDSGGKASKELVPKRYQTTPIEVQVQPKSNTIDIALTSK